MNRPVPVKSEFTKPERHDLRELVSEIWEAEAREKLASLADDFQRWRGRELDSGALIEAIHRFHQRGARELYSTYNFWKDADAVARGVVLGFIDEARVPAALRVKLEDRIRRFREIGGPASQDERDEGADGES